jgi:hypothetical protein
MFNTESLQEKWKGVLDHSDVAPINDKYKRAVTAAILENQQRAMREERAQQNFLVENPTADNTTGSIDKYDPVLISLVRRAMPNLIAYDIAGVQPMNQPTGLIFAMKSLYKGPGAASGDVGAVADGDEALYYGDAAESGRTGPEKPNTAFSGSQTDAGNPYSTSQGEALSGGRSSATDDTGFGEMGFEIVKTSVEAQTRALRATYTMELAQDLKSVHGLDAEGELANILSTEILAEINREIIDGIIKAAKPGGIGGSAEFDLTADADGRWSVERYKGLIYQLDVESNQIALDSRRGRGNWILASSNVVSAIAAAGMLDYTPALDASMNVDPTGNLLAGTLNGRMKVYIDPYATKEEVTVGYRGTNPYDAGVFYCPYVPLTMVRAIGENDFQPRIGFKTRYGMRANPFVDGSDAGTNNRFGGAGKNYYFRNFEVKNLIGASTVS